MFIIRAMKTKESVLSPIIMSLASWQCFWLPPCQDFRVRNMQSVNHVCPDIFSVITGVYFEKILKDSKTPLWIRNIQMGMTAILLALGGVYFSGVKLAKKSCSW